MSLFKKRNTLTENITYMAIMAAINVIFVLISTLVPFLLFLLIFVLPLSSAIVAMFCKKRYYVIYAVATAGLCLLTTIWNMADTFYYVIPSLITGFLFGMLYRKGIPSLIQILIITFVQLCLSYLTIYIFEILFTGRNFLDDLSSILGLSEYKYLSYVKSLFLYATSLIQTIFAYIVITNELSKFDSSSSLSEKSFDYSITVSIISGLTIICYFIIPEMVYPLLLSSCMIGLFLLVDQVMQENKTIKILSPLATALGIILVFCLFSYIPSPLSFITIGISPLLQAIIGIVNNSLKTRK